MPILPTIPSALVVLTTSFKTFLGRLAASRAQLGTIAYLLHSRPFARRDTHARTVSERLA